MFTRREMLKSTAALTAATAWPLVSGSKAEADESKHAVVAVEPQVKSRFLTTGLDRLDVLLGHYRIGQPIFQPVDLTLIVGYVGSGKTSLLSTIVKANGMANIVDDDHEFVAACYGDRPHELQRINLCETGRDRLRRFSYRRADRENQVARFAQVQLCRPSLRCHEGHHRVFQNLNHGLFMFATNVIYVSILPHHHWTSANPRMKIEVVKARYGINGVVYGDIIPPQSKGFANTVI